MFPKSENPQGFHLFCHKPLYMAGFVFAVCHSGKELLCDMWFLAYVMQDISYYEWVVFVMPVLKRKAIKSKRAIFSRKYYSLVVAHIIFFLDQEQSYNCFKNKDIRLPLLKLDFPSFSS